MGVCGDSSRGAVNGAIAGQLPGYGPASSLNAHALDGAGPWATAWKDDVAGNMHRSAPAMESHMRHMLEEGAARNWHRFYQRNRDKFYKDRHYLHHAFPGICNVPDDGSSSEGVAKSAGSSAEATPTPPAASLLMGFGCGVGNALFPLVELDPGLRVIGLDFAPEAIALFRRHPLYDGVRVRAYVQDLADKPFGPEAAAEVGRVDKVLCLFCLSAVHPSKMHRVVQKAWDALRPGGRFFFRDYTRGDHAQVRFGSSKKIEENFYMRQDGTRVRDCN